MNRITAQPKNLRDVWLLYSAYLEAENKLQKRSLVKSALFRYTLPGYGLTPVADTDAKLAFMVNIPLTEFVDAINIQQKYFDQLNLKKSVQRTNRFRLKQMLQWCSHQLWWKAATSAEPGVYSPRRRNNFGNAHHARPSKRRGVTRYGLNNLEPSKLHISLGEAKHMSVELDRIYRELEKLRKFLTDTHVYKRQDKAIRQPTANKVIQNILLIYGWLYHYQDLPLESINLRKLDDIALAYDYTSWLREERKVSPKSELQAVVALSHVAKFNHCQESDQRLCESLSKSYFDISIITELRRLSRDISARVKSAPASNVDESQKWLRWPDYLACVEFLREDCGLLTSEGLTRTERAIARSYQRYLTAALLAYVPPDRQRTFRELRLGQTLVKGVLEQGILHPNEHGKWFICLEADQYKTGDTYGRHIQQIPEMLYPYLEDWLNRWRPVLNPQHDFMFSQLDGKPLTTESFYQLFRHAIYRASANLFGTGKALNPHLVRDMLVTYCNEIGASEAQMEGLAIAMKHSRRTQQQIYDRRSQQQKIKPALDLMASFQPTNVFD